MLTMTNRLPIINQMAYVRQALLAGKHVMSEKPVSENIQEAVAMIKWYRSEIKGPSWTIAENWRFLESYRYAFEELKTLGRIIGFQGQQHALVEKSGKFYSKILSFTACLERISAHISPRNRMAEESHPPRWLPA
jgi:hypothetical protein